MGILDRIQAFSCDKILRHILIKESVLMALFHEHVYCDVHVGDDVIYVKSFHIIRTNDNISWELLVLTWKLGFFTFQNNIENSCYDCVMKKEVFCKPFSGRG